jgi:hypothetical protein
VKSHAHVDENSGVTKVGDADLCRACIAVVSDIDFEVRSATPYDVISFMFVFCFDLFKVRSATPYCNAM